MNSSCGAVCLRQCHKIYNIIRYCIVFELITTLFLFVSLQEDIPRQLYYICLYVVHITGAYVLKWVESLPESSIINKGIALLRPMKRLNLVKWNQYAIRLLASWRYRWVSTHICDNLSFSSSLSGNEGFFMRGVVNKTCKNKYSRATLIHTK